MTDLGDNKYETGTKRRIPPEVAGGQATVPMTVVEVHPTAGRGLLAALPGETALRIVDPMLARVVVPEGRLTAEATAGQATDRTTVGTVHPIAGGVLPRALLDELGLVTAGQVLAPVVLPEGPVSMAAHGCARPALPRAGAIAPAVTRDLQTGPGNRNRDLLPGGMSGGDLPEAVPRGAVRIAAVAGAPPRGGASQTAAETGAEATPR
jgi:hypothetical protein